MKIQISVRTDGKVFEKGIHKVNSTDESVVNAIMYLINSRKFYDDGTLRICNLKETKTNNFLYQIFFHPIW